MKAFILLFISFLITYCKAQFFPCLLALGTCNKCVNFSGVVVALTRDVCGPYSRAKCLQIYNGPAGLCADGCNTCTCGAKRVISSRMACPAYNHVDCLATHGANWECNRSMCYCNIHGVAFSH